MALPSLNLSDFGLTDAKTVDNLRIFSYHN